MPQTWNVPWQNQNSQRAYPLTEDATRLDQSGSFRLPDSFILGLIIPVHIGLVTEPQNFYIKRVVVFPTGYSITVGYFDGDTNPDVATTAFGAADHTEGRTYGMAGIEDFAESIGHITIGGLDEINEQPAGQFTFDYAGGKLEVDAIRPQLKGLSSLVIVNGTERSDPIVGHIELVAAGNTSISISTVSGQPTRIFFNAIEGEGLNDDCVCTSPEGIAPAIRTINGIAPSSTGEFALLFGNCVRGTAVTNGIMITDTCSSPCCGCKDLEVVTAALAAFGNDANTTGQLVTRLEGQVNMMANVMAGSKLADSGCLTCD